VSILLSNRARIAQTRRGLDQSSIEIENWLKDRKRVWEYFRKKFDQRSRWSEEIFADLFSVLATGPWGAWAMAELEMADEASMLVDRPRYPKSIARLSLLYHRTLSF